jgi:hypothetical protein
VFLFGEDRAGLEGRGSGGGRAAALGNGFEARGRGGRGERSLKRGGCALNRNRMNDYREIR